MTIPEKARQLMQKRKVIALATSTSDGKPNVVPMLQYWWFGEDELVVGDMYMKATRRNLEQNPRASFSVWDEASGESYKYNGSARYETDGDAYEMANEHLQKKKPGKKFKGVVIVKVSEVYDAARGEKAGTLIASDTTTS